MKTIYDTMKTIYDMTRSYCDTVHAQKPFVPGETMIPVAGRVFDHREVQAAIDASLEFWLTSGEWTKQFEKAFSEKVGVKHCAFVNSGSSANLLAISALTQPDLGDARIMPGDEVITVAAGFPTTVAPIIQCGANPVFVDLEPIEKGGYNVNPVEIEKAISERTKAVMLAHTLGNPFDVDAVKSICKKHRLWLIEDCCDALGSVYRGQQVGTFGDISTFSFYPAHHITTGEGGMVCAQHREMSRIIRSLRDWGRDCRCETGEDNRCGKRFEHRYDVLPDGWDHKYVYSHFGYNLKATDLQAAIGCAQIEKLDGFISARKRNWFRLHKGLSGLEDKLILPYPTDSAYPSWFGFPISTREGVKRAPIIRHLEKAKIQTRMLFAGDITSQPCFDDLEEGDDYRVIGPLPNTARVLHRTFWIGVYPGITDEMVDYMVERIHMAVKQ